IGKTCPRMTNSRAPDPCSQWGPVGCPFHLPHNPTYLLLFGVLWGARSTLRVDREPPSLKLLSLPHLGRSHKNPPNPEKEQVSTQPERQDRGMPQGVVVEGSTTHTADRGSWLEACSLVARAIERSGGTGADQRG